MGPPARCYWGVTTTATALTFLRETMVGGVINLAPPVEGRGRIEMSKEGRDWPAL